MTTTALNATQQVDALYANVASCSTCPRVHHSRVLTPANGPVDARVLFVAEAPGRRGAARTGIPLTGDESGRRFDAFLALAGLRRDGVFITNAVLCNPVDAAGNNRTPLRSEITNCRPFLETTLDIVRAPLVVALGRVALDALAAIEPHGVDFARDVARPRSWRGRALVALYHPGRQSTLHRPHDAQVDDWLALAAILSPAMTCSPRTVI